MPELEISPLRLMQERAREWKRRPGRSARALLARKTEKNRPTPYRYFNGERMVSFFCPHNLYEFSGSSINRHIDAKAKSKTENLPEAMPETVHAGAPGKLDDVLHSIETGEHEDTGNLAGGDDGKKYALRMLSARSKQKIREKTGAFFRARGKNSTFITLSFIEAVDDRRAISLLNKFFTQVRKDYGDFEYIWVIERQQENEKFKDNPHFHIIIDRRLSVTRYNSLWVMQQYNEGMRGYSKKLGRVLHYDEVKMMHDETMKLIREFRAADKAAAAAGKRKDFKEKTKMQKLCAQIEEKIHAVKLGRFLNPFDIKKVRTLDGLSCYLTKYVTKNKSEFACSTWRCSRGVSALFTKMQTSYDLWKAAGSEINSVVNEETGEYRCGEYIEVYAPKVDPVTKEKVIEKTGYPVATMIYIYNKKYFSQYMKVLDKLNQWVLNGFVPDFRRLEHDEYMRRTHNYQWLN